MSGPWERLKSQRVRRERTASGSTPVGEQRPRAESDVRRRVNLDGFVTAVLHRPTSGGAEALVAVLECAGGTVELVWLGRRSISGLSVGTRLRARGLLTMVRGRSTVFNPTYEFASPEELSA